MKSLDLCHARRAVVDHRFASPCISFGVGAAPNLGGGISDATRVEADQVEVFGDRAVGEGVGDVGDEVDR